TTAGRVCRGLRVAARLPRPLHGANRTRAKQQPHPAGHRAEYWMERGLAAAAARANSPVSRESTSRRGSTVTRAALVGERGRAAAAAGRQRQKPSASRREGATL